MDDPDMRISDVEDEGPPGIPYEEWVHASRRRKKKRRRKIKDYDMSWRATYQPRQIWDLRGASHLAASALPEGFPERLAFRALAAYAFLRTLSIELRLSPFNPNVFLRALYLPYPNKLIGQIHVALLRILLPNLGHGYCYRPRAGGVGIVKKRDGERFELRAGDNLTYLDAFTWPAFYDDYVHLSAELLHAYKTDTTNHVDFDAMEAQEELERKDAAEAAAAAEAETDKLKNSRVSREAKRGGRRMLRTKRKAVYSSESEVEEDDPEEQSDYELDEDDVKDDDDDLLDDCTYLQTKAGRPRRPRRDPTPPETTFKRPRGRPRKHQLPSETTTKKPRGRPRKHPLPSEATIRPPRWPPRKHPPSESETTAKRARGRPRKHPLPSETVAQPKPKEQPIRPPSLSFQVPGRHNALSFAPILPKAGLPPTASYATVSLPTAKPAQAGNPAIVENSAKAEAAATTSKQQQLASNCEERKPASDASTHNEKPKSTETSCQKYDQEEKSHEQEGPTRRQVYVNSTAPRPPGAVATMFPGPYHIAYPPVHGAIYPAYVYPMPAVMPYPMPPPMMYPPMPTHAFNPIQPKPSAGPAQPAPLKAKSSAPQTATTEARRASSSETSPQEPQRRSSSTLVPSAKEARSSLASHPAAITTQPVSSTQAIPSYSEPPTTKASTNLPSLGFHIAKETQTSVSRPVIADKQPEMSTHPAPAQPRTESGSISVPNNTPASVTVAQLETDSRPALVSQAIPKVPPPPRPVQRPMVVPIYEVPKFSLTKRETPPSSPQKLSGTAKTVMSFVSNENAKPLDGIVDEDDEKIPLKSSSVSECKGNVKQFERKVEDVVQVSREEPIGLHKREGTNIRHDPESDSDTNIPSLFDDWPQFEAVDMMRDGQPYHRLPLEQKVQILEFLIDELLCVDFVAEKFTDREAALSSYHTPYGPLPSRFDYETLDNADECAVCGLEGDLLCCDGCPGSYHRKCIGMRQDDDLPDKWLCPDCQIADSTKFGPLYASRKASIGWFNVRELWKSGTGELTEGGDRDDHLACDAQSVDEDDIGESLMSMRLLVVHGFVFVKRAVESGGISGAELFDRLKSAHVRTDLLNQSRVFQILRQMGPSVLSSWPICHIPFEPSKVMRAGEPTGEFISPAIYLMLRVGSFDPSRYENVYRGAPALRAAAKHSSLAFVDFETECAVPDTRVLTSLVQPDMSCDVSLSVALRSGRSLFDPHKMISSYLVGLELTLKRAYLLDEFWGTKNDKAAGVWSLNATKCRSVQRFAILALKLVDGMHRRAFVDDWHGPPSGRVKNDLDSAVPVDHQSQSNAIVFNPLTSDWTPESEKRHHRWDTASLSDFMTLLSEEVVRGTKRPRSPRKRKVAQKKSDALVWMPGTETDAEWNFDGQKTDSAMRDALYSMAGTSPAIDTANDNDSSEKLGSRRGSRRSGRRRSRADYSEYSEFEAPDSATQLQESKRRKLSELSTELSSSSSTPEATWPVAGRRLFDPSGYLPAAEMRRLGRNAGIVRAASVTYSKTYEVGQPALYHVWRKRAMNCTTYEDLCGLLRVLEAHLNRNAMNTCESLAQRSRYQKSGMSKVILCSQKELSTGSTCHFVVHSEKRRGCWISEESIGLSVLAVEYEKRSQMRRQTYRARIGSQAVAGSHMELKRNSPKSTAGPSQVDRPTAVVSAAKSVATSSERKQPSSSHGNQSESSLFSHAELPQPPRSVAKQPPPEVTAMKKLKERVNKISLRHKNETKRLLQQCMHLGIDDVPVSQMKVIRNGTTQRLHACRQEFADVTTPLSLDAIYDVITTAEAKAQDDLRSERTKKEDGRLGEDRTAPKSGPMTQAPSTTDATALLTSQLSRSTELAMATNSTLGQSRLQNSALLGDAIGEAGLAALLSSRSAGQARGLVGHTNHQNPGILADQMGLSPLASITSASLLQRQAALLSPSLASQAIQVPARNEQETRSLLASLRARNHAMPSPLLNLSSDNRGGNPYTEYMTLALREERALQASMNALERQRQRTAAAQRQQAVTLYERETTRQTPSPSSDAVATGAATGEAARRNPVDEIMRQHHQRFFG